jgi:hypothetical protein
MGRKGPLEEGELKEGKGDEYERSGTDQFKRVQRQERAFILTLRQPVIGENSRERGLGFFSLYRVSLGK